MAPTTGDTLVLLDGTVEAELFPGPEQLSAIAGWTGARIYAEVGVAEISESLWGSEAWEAPLTEAAFLGRGDNAELPPFDGTILRVHGEERMWMKVSGSERRDGWDASLMTYLIVVVEAEQSGL